MTNKLLITNINSIKIFSDSDSENTSFIKTLKSYSCQKSYYFLTKYEKARVIGLRALQISSGSRIHVELEGEIHPIQIALKEFRERKIPFIIRRHLPGNKIEDIKLKDMIYC